MNIENFERAFDPGTGSCRAICDCGKVFYNPGGEWDWEDGELEKLNRDQEAISVDHAVGDVLFEGTAYVMDCDCWHDRARQIMGFIDGHAHQIAKYLNFEKSRKIAEANKMPSV